MTTRKARTTLPGPHGIKQIQSLREIFRDPPSALEQLRGAYGSICGFGIGPLRLAVIGDPKLLHELFAIPSDNFRWGHKFNTLGFVVGSGSMIVSDGPDHDRRRASVQTAFSRKRLNGWIPMILERTDTSIDQLINTATNTKSGEEPVNLAPIVRTLALTIAVHALLGEGLASRADEIAVLFEQSQTYIALPFIKQLPHPFPFTKRARVRADRSALDTIINDEIAQRRRQPTGDPLDMLEALIKNGTLSDSEIRDQVVTMIGAGYDTTTAALSWMLWCAVLTPDVWARLRAEADEVLGDFQNCVSSGATTVDYTTLAALTYANQVMRETLRLHPPGVPMPREAAVDIEIGEYTIKKGTLILWSPYLAGRDIDAWHEPLKFEPERFSDLTPEQQAITDQAWVPFGRGARNCIGFALAQMELTLIISRLAQRVDMETSDFAIPKPVGMIINRPTGGAPFRVTCRSQP